MRLIIAEKPSVGRGIAEAVGATTRRDGYIEGPGTLVSWCRGHVVELCPPTAYERWAGHWDMDQLPMIPGEGEWKWEVSESAADQFRVLATLISRPDVDELVNACDADREGEAIFRRVYDMCGLGKPVTRLWSTSLVPEQVRADLAAARPQSEYDGLAAAAEGRAKADWLVGMNASRAYCCLYPGSRLSAGRVQTPTLALVVDRTRRAAAFKSAPFFQPFIELGGFSAFGERMEDADAARSAASAASAAGTARVKEAEEHSEKNRAPRLYDLTGLQRDASTRAGLSADETLSALQSLYEKKLATYPRTESKFICSADRELAERALALASDPGVVGPAAAAAFDDARADVARVVDDSKVHGHGAILPTELCDAAAVAALAGAERTVMQLVCCRLLAAVMDPATRIKRRLVAECAGREYSASGTTVADASWIAVDDAARALVGGGDDEAGDGDPAQSLPPGLAPGDSLAVVSTGVREGKTTPPRPYTDASLLSAMENAGRSISDKDLKAAMDDDSSHSGGLGTPATRAATIEALVAKGYVKRKGRSLVATDKGMELIDAVSDSLKTPELTARWELELSRVEREGAPLRAFLDGIREYTGQIVDDAKESFDPARAAALAGDAQAGPCPICGAPVVRRAQAKAWQCSSNKFRKAEDGSFELASGCGFRLLARQFGKELTAAQTTKLLSGRPVHVKGLRRKDGTEFEADLILGDPPYEGWARLAPRAGGASAAAGRGHGRKGKK